MSYIILNGKSSNLIGGLMIQSLPPITKPLMRTSVEQIDGRDGDIITNLGYSAYDKDFSIGLYGDYDVDEVIRYFDSEGTVIFSNELGKYYRYQIIDQIDFEKLIRFKTATVTMHVQPFKYSAVEKPLIMGNMVSIPDYSITQDGVSVSVSDGEISASGIVSGMTEIYIPIKTLHVLSGNYKFICNTAGSGVQSCAVRLINGSPLDSHSLGGTFLRFDEGENHVEITQTKDYSFNYLWLCFDQNGAVDFTASLSLLSYQFKFTNIGNTTAKPKLTLYGSGNIILALNGVNIMAISMATDSITIDAESMEAFQGNVLLNRNIIGNYDSLVLKSGLNVLSWKGIVTKAVLERYARWI